MICWLTPIMDHLNDGNDSVCVEVFILVLVYINVIEIELFPFSISNLKTAFLLLME